MAFSILTAWRGYHQQNWGNFAFALFNAVLAAGAIRAYIGLSASAVDMALGVVNWVYVDTRKKEDSTTSSPTPDSDADWSAILYYGDRRLARDLRSRGDRRHRTRHLLR